MIILSQFSDYRYKSGETEILRNVIHNKMNINDPPTNNHISLLAKKGKE